MQQPGQQNQPTPKQVFEEAHRLMRMGDLYEAARRAGKLRMHFPEDTPILTLHGLVLARLGVHAQALNDLIRAAQQTETALQKEDDENPARPRIVDQLVRLSVQICRSSTAIGEFAAAEEAIDNALEWDPERGDAVGAKAELLAAQGNHGEALKLIDEGQKEKMDELPLVLAKARVLLSQESASEDAMTGVAGELDQQAQVAGQSALDLGDLLRTLGTVYDRLGRHDDAFASFRRAAKLRRGGYDPRNYTTMTTKVIHDWSAQNMSKIVRPEESGERYVFLLGAPKSGVEELAAMLGQFDGATVIGPLETLSSVCVRHLNARQGVLRPVPLEPQKLRGAQIREAAQAYRGQVAGHFGESTVRAIDTHPLNIPLAGAAALMLPGVQLVMCRRNPIEATLATYCDAMPGNHPYAAELLNTAGFVADCNRMLEHWAKVLGDEAIGAEIIQVQYEDLAKDPARTAASVAKQIGLEADASSVTRVPEIATGPGAHPEHYKGYLKQITDLFTPTAKA